VSLASEMLAGIIGRARIAGEICRSRRSRTACRSLTAKRPATDKDFKGVAPPAMSFAQGRRR
jgi:hypothetical protein